MLRRYAPLLIGLGGAGIVLPFAVGIGPGLVAMFLLPLFGGLGVLGLVGMRRTAAAETGWSMTARSADLEADLVDLRQWPADPSRRRPAREWRVAAALSRVEARDLGTSLWLGVGIGFLAVSLLMFVGLYGPESGEHWNEVVLLAPWLAHPFVGMVVLAAHHAVTRARRDGCDELFTTCPASLGARTWGFLATAWVPVAVLAGFCALYAAGSWMRSPGLYGAPGPGTVAVVLGALALGAGGTTLGVALGLWVRSALAPVAAVAAIGFVSLRLSTFGDPFWNPLQQLSTMPSVSGEEGTFADTLEWSHLGWLVALTAAVGVIALARHRRDRAMVLAGVAATLLVVGAGLAAVRPLPGASAQRIAARVASPSDVQTCRSSGSIQVCAFPGHEELAARAASELPPVAAALPPSTALVVRQRFAGTLDDLPPEVARRLPGGVPPHPAGEVQLGFSASHDELLRLRSRVAQAAVGLPPEAAPEGGMLDISGQARGALALWLSTLGVTPSDALTLTTSRNDDDHWCTDWPVAWSPEDLRAARALAAAPEAVVRASVLAQWERWLEPATGTDELLAAAGLAPLGPYRPAPDGTSNPC